MGISCGYYNLLCNSRKVLKQRGRKRDEKKKWREDNIKE